VDYSKSDITGLLFMWIFECWLDAMQRLYKWRLENCPNTEGNPLFNKCDVYTFRSNAQLLLHLKECVKYSLKPALERMGQMRNWIGNQEGKRSVGVFRNFWKSCVKINLQERRCEGVDCSHQPRDMDKRRNFTNTVELLNSTQGGAFIYLQRGQYFLKVYSAPCSELVRLKKDEIMNEWVTACELDLVSWLDI
jgi:hypothetical protein